MRPAPGAAHRRVALDAERVEDVGDVVRDRGDVATGIRRRASVAGPVVGDQPEAALTRTLDVRRIEVPATGRAVMHDDDGAVGIPRVADAKRSPVAKGDVPYAHSPGFSGVPGRPSGTSARNLRATGSGQIAA